MTATMQQQQNTGHRTYERYECKTRHVLNGIVRVAIAYMTVDLIQITYHREPALTIRRVCPTLCKVTNHLEGTEYHRVIEYPGTAN